MGDILLPPHPQTIRSTPARSEPYADMFNVGTRGYYCLVCASGINWRPNVRLYIPVDHDLTREEMDKLDSWQMSGTTG